MSSREENDGDSQPLQGDSQPLQGDTRKPPADVTKSSRHVDELYNELGDPGRFQILVFVMLAFTFLSVSSNMVVGVFFSYTPEHVCDAAGDFRVNRGAVNSTDSPPYAVGNITGWSTSPVVGTLVNGNLTNVTSRGSCWAVVDNTTRTCDRGQWKYDLDGPESSAVSDFDLVCSRAYLRYLANTLFYIGIMLGSFGFGYFSDVVGRRPVVMVTVYASCGLGVAISFVENYALFVFLRFLMGVVLQGMMTSTYVMTIEQFSCHYRGKAGAGIQVFWGLGNVYLGAAAWLVKDWRILQLAIVAPAALTGLYIWLVPESLRWLLVRGKTHRANLVIKRVTWFNQLERPTDDDHALLSEYQVDKEERRGSYLDLLRVPELRKRTVCMSFIWFAANVGYFGMTYYSEQLAGNRYLNFFLGSLLETFALAVGTVVVVRFGRRKPLMAILIIGSVCCLIAGVFPRDKNQKLVGARATVVTVFSVVGRAAMAMLFNVTDVYAAELFPTVIRNMGVGVCTFMARVGAVVTPQIFSLADYTFYQLPPLVFCVVAVTGAALTYILPETCNQLLPDTVLDIQPNKDAVTSRTVKDDELTLQQSKTSESKTNGSRAAVV